MDFEFSDDQELLRESVRRFLAEKAPFAYTREMYDDDRGVTDDVWRGVAAMGLTGILVPEEHGGLGLGMVDVGPVLEEMGRAVHPGPFLASAVGATSLIALAGSPSQRAALLPGFATGDTIGTVGVDEPEQGFEWSTPQTTAKPSGDAWSIRGSKVGVADALAASLLVVVARDDDGGVGAFVVDVDAAGVEIAAEATVDGSRKRARVDLDGAAAHRLGDGDCRDAIAAVVDRLTTGIVVDGVGCAAAALEQAVAYAKDRMQFDRPIGSFQAVQHLCADMLYDLELARAGAYHALWACDAATSEERHRAVTMAKAWASDALFRVGAGNIQVHGGIGFTWEHDAHLFYKRLLTLQHALGSTRHHLEDLAAQLLD